MDYRSEDYIKALNVRVSNYHCNNTVIDTESIRLKEMNEKSTSLIG